MVYSSKTLACIVFQKKYCETLTSKGFQRFNK